VRGAARAARAACGVVGRARAARLLVRLLLLQQHVRGELEEGDATRVVGIHLDENGFELGL
jgi:hypothetical protein